MKLTVHHTTHYRYSRPVWLQPHTIRLRPRADGATRVERCEIHIEPTPSARSECIDAEGNAVLHAWFSATTTDLRVVTSFEVEMLRANPFDYLLAANADTLPIRYDAEFAAVLAPSLAADGDAEVQKFARALADAAGGRTLDFLNALNAAIYDSCRIFIRETGAPNSAGYTLAHREGSCRDVAVLFIEACRAVGIAARFVSGYQCGDPGNRERYMHAWAEVYLPGGGWRGYDPTHGLAVHDGHIAVAASHAPGPATPIEGSFRGSGATATMDAQVSIS